MGLKSKNWYHLRERRERFGHRQAQTGKGHVKAEAEIGAMLPQTKECQKVPEGGGGMGRFSPRAFGGSSADTLNLDICSSKL